MADHFSQGIQLFPITEGAAYLHKVLTAITR
jgi:hypothetical protein